MASQNGANYTEGSTNGKIAGERKVDATHVALASCDPSCKLRGHGCYAEQHPLAFTVSRLDDMPRLRGRKALAYARAEASLIDASHGGGPVPKGRPLRLHVSGDSTTTEAALLVDLAVGRWQERGGGPAWSYTHSYRDVDRLAWAHVSVLASCETDQDVKDATSRKYAPALVVDAFPNGAAAFHRAGMTFIPCPAQVRDDTACTECRLCWNADKLLMTNRGIAFEAHGAQTKKVRRRLAVLQEGAP